MEIWLWIDNLHIQGQFEDNTGEFLTTEKQIFSNLLSALQADDERYLEFLILSYPNWSPFYILCFLLTAIIQTSFQLEMKSWMWNMDMSVTTAWYGARDSPLLLVWSWHVPAVRAWGFEIILLWFNLWPEGMVLFHYISCPSGLDLG